MLFPEELYYRYLREKGRPPYTRMNSTPGTYTAATATLLQTFPDDADTVVENIFLKVTVAGGETLSRAAYHLFRSGENAGQPNLIDEDFGLTSTEYNKNFANTPLYIPRGYILGTVLTKSAAVQLMTVQLNVWGFCIPPMDL